MRILQINCVYKQGSTGKIVACLAQELRNKGHEVFTCYGNGSKYYDVYSKRICKPWEHKFNSLLGRITGVQYGGLYISNFRLEKILNLFQPEIVHVHCMNGSVINVYNLLRMLARKNIKTVISLHAEIYHTGGCSHAYDCNKWKQGCHDCTVFKKECYSYFFERSQDCWNKIHDAFQTFNPENLIITAVSPWLAERARQSDVMKGFKVISVLNGLNPDVFHYRESKGLIDRRNYENVILYVTPCFNTTEGDLKGGKFVIQLAERVPEHKIVVVASRIESALTSIPKNVYVWGKANNQEELAQIYSEADATILFSSRETFSMVTAESLCCGTFVVGFKAGGPESIALPDYSTFVNYGDLNAIVASLNNILPNIDILEKQRVSSSAIKVYSQTVMCEEYLNVYRMLNGSLNS